MAFPTGYLADPQGVGSGERYDPNSALVLTARTFEDGLLIGRFAKLDAGSLDNMDASATPTIAGVVLRSPAQPVEDGDAIDSSLYKQVEYQRGGLVTVEVVAGDTPAQFGAVYAENQTAGEYGKATTTATGNVAVNAEWIEEVRAGVWLINIKR